jgi:hypothetical protein
LIDAGVSPFGQPYLVLEHVDGEPIDRHDTRGLDGSAHSPLPDALTPLPTHTELNRPSGY